MASRTVDQQNYRFGFNGKENDGETSTQDYGMRIYNPALGKFLSVDPISYQYPELTPYQFASNRPVDGIDLDGLEHFYAPNGELLGKYGESTEIRFVDEDYVGSARAYFANPDNYKFMEKDAKKIIDNYSHKAFETMDDAALHWGMRYNSVSIKDNIEMASVIYKIEIEGKWVINYNKPKPGSEHGSYPNIRPSLMSIEIGDIHSHSAYQAESDEFFSTGDKSDNDRNRTIGYLTTPQGQLKKYDPTTKKVTTLSTSLPSDPKAPNTKNKEHE